MKKQRLKSVYMPMNDEKLQLRTNSSLVNVLPPLRLFAVNLSMRPIILSRLLSWILREMFSVIPRRIGKSKIDEWSRVWGLAGQ